MDRVIYIDSALVEAFKRCEDRYFTGELPTNPPTEADGGSGNGETEEFDVPANGYYVPQ